MKRLFVLLAIVLLLAVTVYLFRLPVLQSFSNGLIHQDKLQKADVLFLLSGGSYDRGNEAAKLFHQEYCKQIVCTGGNPVVELKVFNMDTLESDMAVANLKRLGVPDSCIVQLKYGTSTRQECDTIVSYCKAHSLQKAIVVSSLLHTSRVNSVFHQKMEAAGTGLILHGAPSSRFNENYWWQSEDGLIAVNNEWIKTLYYWVKY